MPVGKILLGISVALFCSSVAFAEQCQITSPLPVPVTISGCTFSGSLPSNSTSYIQNTLSPTTTTQVYSVQRGTVTDSFYLPYLAAGQCVQTGTGGLLSVTGSACGSGSGGGGGSSPLAVNQNGIQITSPTAALNALSPPFKISAVSGTTAQWTLDSSSVTLQGNAITFSSLQTQVNNVGVSTGNIAAFFPVSVTTGIVGILPVANGGTATASPGLIAGTNITSITGTWPNQTINATTQSGGGGGGSSSLAVTTGTFAGFNNPPVSSPTAVVNFDQRQFNASLPAGNTVFLTLNASSVTLLGQTPNASNLSGTLAAAQFPALTGDTTSQAGALTTSVVAIHLTPGPSLCTAGQYSRGIDTNGNGAGCTVAAAGPNSFTLAIVTGTTSGFQNPPTSSATNTTTILNFNSSQFLSSLPAGSTVFIGVNTSSFTMLGPTVDAGSKLTGILATAQFPALTGDVTNSASSLAMTAAATQANITTLSNANGITVSVGSMTIVGPGGVTSSFGIKASTAEVTGASVTINGVAYKFPTSTSITAGTPKFFQVDSSSNVTLGTPAGAGTVTTTGSPSSGQIAKFSGTTSITNGVAADIVGTFSGCSGVQYLGADGACHAAGGGSPGGSTYNVQVASFGAFAGATNFNVYDSSIVTNEAMYASTMVVTNGSMTVVGAGTLQLDNVILRVSVSTDNVTQDNGIDFINYVSTGFVITGSTNVTSAVLTDIPGFAFNMGASETWTYDCQLSVTGASGGTEYGVNGPAGATTMTMIFGTVGAVGTFSTAVVTALNTADTVAFATVAAGINVRVTGEMTTSTTAGTFRLARKAVTGGTTNTMNAGSFCSMKRIL